MNITIFHRVNDAHSGMDDCADWAIKNMAQLRTAEIDVKPAKLVKNGCTYQGRFEGQPDAAECCTEVGADGVPSAWENADLGVFFFFAKGLFGVLSALFLMWVYANA